jgi:hypothetical protein
MKKQLHKIKIAAENFSQRFVLVFSSSPSASLFAWMFEGFSRRPSTGKFVELFRKFLRTALFCACLTGVVMTSIIMNLLGRCRSLAAF